MPDKKNYGEMKQYLKTNTRERKEERKIHREKERLKRDMWKCSSLLVILNDSNLCIKWASSWFLFSHKIFETDWRCSIELNRISSISKICSASNCRHASLFMLECNAHSYACYRPRCWKIGTLMKYFFFFSCQIGLHLTSLEVFLPNLYQ